MLALLFIQQTYKDKVTQYDDKSAAYTGCM
jgi:hypothetical protein